MVISDETRAAIDVEIARYPKRRGALLPALHLVQREHGCVSEDSAAELAEIFEIRAIDVLEVVSFYNMFYDRPQPRHHVYVCTNLPCSLRGGRTLLRQLEAHVGSKVGVPTEDGKLVLGHEECLGACAYAPMLRIDDTYYEDLDADRAKRILDELE
ncbi:MAG: NADH-quinone oxidoreductase subunit NuoE [bacterium]|nr:NADH-quinone oxidoreductase subunit NuoE [bacterium]